MERTGKGSEFKIETDKRDLRRSLVPRGISDPCDGKRMGMAPLTFGLYYGWLSSPEHNRTQGQQVLESILPFICSIFFLPSSPFSPFCCRLVFLGQCRQFMALQVIHTQAPLQARGPGDGASASRFFFFVERERERERVRGDGLGSLRRRRRAPDRVPTEESAWRCALSISRMMGGRYVISGILALPHPRAHTSASSNLTHIPTVQCKPIELDLSTSIVTWADKTE